MLLEHHATVGTGADDGFSVQQDFAGGRRQEAGDAVEQGGLATAGGAQRDDEVTVVHGEVDGGQRLQRAALDCVVDREVPDV
jgi:hypothetical protein